MEYDKFEIWILCNISYDVLFFKSAVKTEKRNFLLVKFFCFQERKTFTGHWVNGKRTGPGKMIWLNGEEYNGEWLNNLQVNFRH